MWPFRFLATEHFVWMLAKLVVIRERSDDTLGATTLLVVRWLLVDRTKRSLVEPYKSYGRR